MICTFQHCSVAHSNIFIIYLRGIRIADYVSNGYNLSVMSLGKISKFLTLRVRGFDCIPWYVCLLSSFCLSAHG